MSWIKLHRNLTDWEWYDDQNATRLLIHLLLTVNYEDKKWKGIEIKAGSRVTSWDVLSSETGLTSQKVRTAMEKLINSKEVTRQITNRFQLVTLVKWGKLQSKEVGDNKQSNRQITDKQQTDNRQITTTKEIKNNKNMKNNIEDRKIEFWQTLHPFFDSYDENLLKDFYEYWTESSPRAKKMRWEKEKAFDITRRLKNWVKREQQYGTQKVDKATQANNWIND